MMEKFSTYNKMHNVVERNVHPQISFCCKTMCVTNVEEQILCQIHKYVYLSILYGWDECMKIHI